MTTPGDRDYFTDRHVLKEPYAFFKDLYSVSPVYYDPNRDIYYITGFPEALEILRNTEVFSSINSVGSASVPLPFAPEGDDISEELEQHRDHFPGSNLIVAYDGQMHENARSLTNRLFTPSRLKANEEFMQTLSRQLVAEAVSKGGCELLREVATPYATLVIADLLGVPEEDRREFRRIYDESPPAGNLEAADQPRSLILEKLGAYFFEYIQNRRDNPREDILSELANAKFPDGSTPDLLEVVRNAMFLFGAGQDTTAKLLGNTMLILTERPELQRQLRDDRALIPAFIEETLRYEGAVKITSRLARRNTKVGDKDIAAGSRLVIALSAANRDPRRWDDPEEFKLNRDKIREHLGFSRGAHTCIGAPLARAEVSVMLNELFDNTRDIALSPDKHGAPGNRELEFEASFLLRGPEYLYLDMKAS